jgi:hypothetical protein
MINPICASCKKSLERLDMSRGAITFGGTLPILYSGVICMKCRRIECTDCRKGRIIDAPCKWCGGEVKPAYANYL